MKCINCQVDIDPKWKHAVQNNICPSCGENIMPEDLKEKIISLKSLIDSFKETYPEQLDDLLLSNYLYVRTDSDRIKDFYPKQSTSVNDPGIINSAVQSVQDQEVTSRFFKNAEVTKSVARAEELKKLVSEIKSNKNTKPAIMDSETLAAEISSYEDGEDDVAHEEYENDDEPIPAAALALSRQPRTTNNADYSAKDIMALQKIHQRSAEARSAVRNGTGGKGSFSRG